MQIGEEIYTTLVVQYQSPYGSFTSWRRNTVFELNFDELTAARKSDYPVFSGYHTSLRYWLNLRNKLILKKRVLLRIT